MAKKKLRVAIAGCHRMLLRDLTHHNFAAAFRTVSENEIVGVFDYDAETRAEFVTCWRDVWGDIPTFGDYEHMLKEIKPDILCIATRQTLHADQIEAATAAGVRGILCDKPLATTLAEMDRIISACTDIPLCFGLDRRWSLPYRYLRENMNGLIGTITSLVAYGLPNTINHGCHWYDALLGLLGDPEPLWVSGLIDHGNSDDERRKLDPPARAQIGLDNGVVAYITTDGGKGPGFQITGTKGHLSILSDATHAHLYREDAYQPLSLPADEELWPTGSAMVRDLVQAIKTGGRTACDINHARRATEIGFAIHHSSKQGGAKIALSDVDRSLRVQSFLWGNEQLQNAPG